MRGTSEESPTGLIRWFSKTEGNTYATLMHHPFLFKGKTNACSRGSRGALHLCFAVSERASEVSYSWAMAMVG